MTEVPGSLKIWVTIKINDEAHPIFPLLNSMGFSPLPALEASFPNENTNVGALWHFNKKIM